MARGVSVWLSLGRACASIVDESVSSWRAPGARHVPRGVDLRVGVVR